MGREQRAEAVAKEIGHLEGFSDGKDAVAMMLLVVGATPAGSDLCSRVG